MKTSELEFVANMISL